MSFIGKIFKGIAKVFPTGLIGLGSSLLSKKKALPAPLPNATRDDAAVLAERNMELLRRRGAAADMLTGTGGSEASMGSIGKLVVGN